MTALKPLFEGGSGYERFFTAVPRHAGQGRGAIRGCTAYLHRKLDEFFNAGVRGQIESRLEAWLRMPHEGVEYTAAQRA